MKRSELENLIKFYEKKLSDIKQMYLREVRNYLNYGTTINSKIVKDSGFYLINLALEMKDLEGKIELLKVDSRTKVV